MEYHETIHRYLAGEATPAEEEQLFAGLADHAEWREELQLQMRLERAAQQDLSTLTVPSMATVGIFSSLGFTQPQSRSRIFRQPNVLAPLSFAVLGIAGYLLFSSPGHHLPVRMPLSAMPQQVIVLDSAAPVNQEEVIVKRITIANANAATVVNKPTIADPASAEAVPHKPVIPNEPIEFYVDIGKFNSVAYLTREKIVGVAEGGKIYASNNGGKTWALKETGTTSDLYGVHFADTLEGLAVGEKGTILRTSEAGTHWQTVSSNTITNLNTVRYATHDTAFACGENGTVIRSFNGGESWSVLNSPTTANLFRIEFRNGHNGELRGKSGIRFITHNAGETWEETK